MGLNIKCSAIDYMLGTIFLVYYLLFSFIYLTNIDPSWSFNLLLNSENNNNTVSINKLYWTNIQSAENCKGFSETIRQLSNPSTSQIDVDGGALICTSTLGVDNNSNTPWPHWGHGSLNYFSRSLGIGRNNSNLILKESSDFYKWFAGIIDGDGNFDIRKVSAPRGNATGKRIIPPSQCEGGNDSNNKYILKAIRIKLHNRDVRILTRIQNYLHFGRIRSDKNKPYSIYIVSTYKDMKYLIDQLNGLIRLKIPGFKKACDYFKVEHIEPDYNISSFDPYFSGLIDTDGSIVFNFNSNRIECNLEFQYNDYTKKLNFDNTIPYYKPYILLRKQKNKINKREYKSIAFKYQTVKGMLYLYDFFMKNRLYSDFKFYRVTKIKEFITIRDYKNEPRNSSEFKIYSDFLMDWIQYRNPLWLKVPFVNKIRLDKEIVQ